MLFALSLGSAFAQTDTSANAYSLQQCIDYALENHTSMKNAKLDYQSSEAKVKETVSIGLPQINGKVDLINNLKVQSQFLPANAFEPTAPEGLVVPIAFGVQYSSNASVTATQLIFDGSYLVGLQAAKVYKELYEKSVTQTKIDVVDKVSKAYYAVLVNEERLSLIRKNKSLIDKLYEDTKAMREAGFADNVSVQRIQVSKNNLDVEISKLESMVQISHALLKFQMGIPQKEIVVLIDKLDALIDDMNTLPEDEVSYENRIEYKMLGIQKNLMELDVKNFKAKALPSLAAFGTVGANIGSLEFGDVFQLGDWRNYSMVGLSLDVPIFSSMQRKHRISQAKISSEKVTNNMEQLEQSIDLELLQSKLTIHNSLKTIDIQKQNMELAEEVYRVTKIKYDEGMASNYEVIDTETALKDAQTNYYNALYEAIIAKIDYEKANGTLYSE